MNARDRLAEALAAQHSCDTLLTIPLCNRCRQSADAVLPVVAELVREGQAEALEAAAVDSALPGIFPSTQRWLLDRAAALRGPRGEGAT